MYDGYLKLGDTEILNSARAKDYGESADCPASWFDCECEGLRDAMLESLPYSASRISEAPWYDPRNPESGRFYGALGLGMRNVSDSTRYAEFTEGITDGGVVGAARRAGRQVRVRAWLTANGEDALEYGMTWLSAAVSSRRCSQHSASCGGASVEFFAACPPERLLIGDYSSWSDVYTNLLTNPSMETAAAAIEVSRNLINNPGFRVDASGWTAASGGGGASTVTRVGSQLQTAPIAGYGRFQVTTVGTWFRALTQTNIGTVVPNQPYTLSGWMRAAPVASDVRLVIQWRDSGGNLLSEVTSSNISVGSSGQRYSFTATAPANASYAIVDFRRMSGAVGDFFDLGATQFERASSPTLYSDGIYSSDPDYVPAWTGTANASPSTLTATSAAQVSVANCFAVQSGRWKGSGSKSLRMSPDPRTTSNSTIARIAGASNAAGMTGMGVTFEAGKTYTVLGTMRLPEAQAGSLSAVARTIRVQASTPGGTVYYNSEQVPNQAGTYYPRVKFTLPADTTGVQVLLCNGSSITDMYWDDLTLVDGDYDGGFFYGDTPNEEFAQYTWLGTPNASGTKLQTRLPVERLQTDAEYLPGIEALKRYFHGVTTISGPLEIQTVKSGQIWGREVEFTLYAEQPGIYAAPRSFGTLESVGEIVDDVVRNLVAYPSAELQTSQTIVAYNHVTNPSLERDATNWFGGSVSGGDDNPPAIGIQTQGIVKGARSYAGESSYLVRWLGDDKTVGTGSRQQTIEYQQRSMPGIASGDVVTVTMWAALVIQAGAALGAGETLSVMYTWVKADGSFVGSTVTLGTASGDDRGGRVFSLSNVTVPATATGILFQVITGNLVTASSPNPAVNRDIRLYADAAGVIEEV